MTALPPLGDAAAMDGGVDRQDEGPWIRVELAGGRGNALSPDRLTALRARFEELVPDPRPVLLAARGRSFCTGLDLLACGGLDRDGMRELMASFHATLAAVALHPAPVVALLQGHALAGGALLALAADRRVACGGQGRFGVHGMALGIPYPDVAVALAEHQLGPRGAARLLLEGELVGMEEAGRRGLVDRLEGAGQLADAAREEALALAGPPFASNKARLRRPLRERLAAAGGSGAERFLDGWFHPATRESLREAMGTLAGGGGRRPGEAGRPE